MDGQRLHPTLKPDEFLQTLPQVADSGSFFSSAHYYYTDDNQLMCVRYELFSQSQQEEPCSHRELLESYGFRKWSAPRVFDFLERLVHPEVRNLGLSWENLVDWWQDSRYFTQNGGNDPRKSLGQRLLESMPDSVPERCLFEAYFTVLRPIYGINLPAMIPQVYVHYDPMTVSMLKKRGDNQRFEKQRMDFLLLLHQGTRVILEIDGIQHYSLNGKPSPDIYAVTVRSDRELRLLGYDVYRFAGIELNSKEKAKKVTESFFRQLFDRHGIEQV